MRYLYLSGWSLLLIVGLVSGCKSTKVGPDNFPDTYLSFGNGGGFMGAYKEYVLLENGQLYQRNKIDTTFSTTIKLKKRMAKPIFEALNELDFSKVNRNSPGNIYKFMEYNKDGKRYRLVWGSANKAEIDERLNKIYKMSMEEVRKGMEEKEQ